MPGRIFMAQLYGTGKGEMEKAKLSLKHLRNGISAAFEVRPYTMRAICFDRERNDSRREGYLLTCGGDGQKGEA